MTDPPPSDWAHHQRAYAMILARWAGDDAALEALPNEDRMPVIRVLIDKIDSQRRLAEQSRSDFLDDYAADINASRTIARFDAEMVGRRPPDVEASDYPTPSLGSETAREFPGHPHSASPE